MNIFELIGDVTVRGMDAAENAVSGLSSNADNLADKLNKTGKSISKAGATTTKFVSGPIMALTAGMMAVANKTADVGDQIAKNSSKLGISTDAYQELSYALGQSGLSSSDFEKSIGRLNQRLGMANEEGNKYRKSLKNLGVDFENLDGSIKDTDKVFMETIQRLHELGDSQLQASKASEIFGVKVSRELMPTIKSGSASIEDLRDKAHELGIVMDGEALSASEGFIDAMDNMKRQGLAIVTTLGSKLIPVLVDDLFPIIQETVIPITLKMSEGLGSVLSVFSSLPEPIQQTIVILTGLLAAAGPVLLVVGNMISAVSTLIPLFASLAGGGGILATVIGALTGPVGIAIVAITALIAVGKALYDNWDAIKSGVSSAIDYIQDKIQSFKDKVTSAVGVVISVLKKLMSVLKYTPLGMAVNLGKNIGQSIKGLANGGEVLESGRVLVGERGPEELELPKGSKVIPLSTSERNSGGLGSKNVKHSGTIRVEGVSDDKTYQRTVDHVIDRLTKEARV